MYYNLLRGQSWYNKFGYYSTDHEDQHRDVAKLRNTALDEYCRSAKREDNLTKILQIDASTPIDCIMLKTLKKSFFFSPQEKKRRDIDLLSRNVLAGVHSWDVRQPQRPGRSCCAENVS